MTTITVHSSEQNVILVSILWAGYLITFIVTAYRVVKSIQVVAAGEESSSGDTSRSLFYRLLGMALLSRLIFIPIQNVANGEMIQLVAETLPQLMFASAWALLVAFFVNLVGTASGGVSSNKPSLVIHIAVYLMYIVLVIWYWWNDAAAVLLYALLCILYASLFGTLVYFGPKLVALLQPSLERQSGLSVRLIIVCCMGVTIFLVHAVLLARTVVSPSVETHVWMTFGVLELLPSTVLLVLMHPSRPKQSQEDNTPPTSSSMKRIPSSGPRANKKPSSTGEMSALLKPQPQYGSSKEQP